MKALAKIILVVFIITLITFSIFITLVFYTKNYDAFIDWILVSLNKNSNWLILLKSRFTITSFLLIKKWLIIYNAIAFCLLIFLIYYFKKSENSIASFFYSLHYKIKQKISTINSLTPVEKYFFYFIIAFAFLKALYYSATLSIQYDEAWSYNYYESNKLWQSFLLPGNNHKLFTMLAWFFNRLPFDKTFLIRLPNAIAGFALLVYFYLFVKKYFNTSIALIGLAWLATCVPVAVFMTLARSYIYVIFFSLLLIDTCFKLLNKNFDKNDFTLTLIILLLGYFANPVFFYTHFCLTFFIATKLLFTKQMSKLKKIILLNLACLPFLFLMYASDIISGHLNSLIRVAFKSATAENYFIKHLRLNALFQLGMPNLIWVYVLIIMAALLLCFINAKKKLQLLQYAVFSIIILPFLAVVQEDDISMFKTIYITISFCLILMHLLQFLFDKFLTNKYFIFTLIVSILSFNSFCLNNHPLITWSINMDKSCKNVSAILINQKAVDCYIFKNYYKPNVQFYFKTKHLPIQLSLADEASVDYEKNSTTANYVLIDKSKTCLFAQKNYQIIYEDKLVDLYKLKK